MSSASSSSSSFSSGGHEREKLKETSVSHDGAASHTSDSMPDGHILSGFGSLQQDMAHQLQQEAALPVLERFKKDATYSQFLRADFDPIAYSSALLRAAEKSTEALPSALAKLSSGMRALDAELKGQVADRHEELFKQVSAVKQLEGMVEVVHGSVDSVQSSLTNIRSELREPFLELQKRTEQLQRIQAACDMLRRVGRFLHLARRFRAKLDSPQKLPEAALALYELEQIRKTSDLSGVHIIDKETKWIITAAEEVISNASNMLLQGMETQNQAQVANALQVFYNLRILDKKLALTATNLTTKVSQTIKTVLSSLELTKEQIQRASSGHTRTSSLGAINGSTNPSAPTANTSTNTATDAPYLGGSQWRTELWTRLERMTDVFHSCCIQMWHLQRVLAKMNDPTSHTGSSLLDLIVKNGADDLFTTFWKTTTRLLKEQLEHTANESTLVENAFVGEYPRLLRLFNDLLRRLSTHYEMEQQQLPHSLSSLRGGDSDSRQIAYEQHLISGLARFEQKYLSLCLDRLFDPINIFFGSSSASSASGAAIPRSASASQLSKMGKSTSSNKSTSSTSSSIVPSKEDIVQLAKTISSELDAAKADLRLNVAVAKVISQALRLFGAKCQSLVVSSSDAFQVTNPFTAAQKLNARIFNALYYLHAAIAFLLPNLASPVITELKNSLQDIARTGQQIVEPLFNRMEMLTEITIMQMHKEDYGRTEPNETVESSPYLELLTRQVQNFEAQLSSEYIYDCAAISARRRALVKRIFVLFVRHAALLRPLSDQGKLKLAAEMAQLELAVAPLLNFNSRMSNKSKEEEKQQQKRKEDATSKKKGGEGGLLERLEQLQQPQKGKAITLSDLGQPYKELRALRPFLFREPEAMLTSPELSSLTLPTVLHHLFSRAPSELRSPHEHQGWTLAKYSKWLDERFVLSKDVPVRLLSSAMKDEGKDRKEERDETKRMQPLQQQHRGGKEAVSSTLDIKVELELEKARKQGEEDVWKLIKQSLDTYAHQVNARGEKSFDPIYPIMLSLGSHLLARK